MVRKPINEAVDQLQVQRATVPVDVSYCSSQTGRYSCWGNPTSLCQDGVVVHKLVFRVGQLEQLREDGVDGDILGLPGRSARWDIPELVEGSCTTGKGALRKVVVDIDEAPRRDSTVVVEDVDRVQESITDQGRSDVRNRRDGLNVRAQVNREVNLREQRARSPDKGLWDRDGWQLVLGTVVQLFLLLYLFKWHRPRSRYARQLPATARLGLELCLQKSDEAHRRGRARLVAFGVVWIYQVLQGVRLTGNDLSLVQKVCSQFCALLTRGRSNGVGYGEEDDLNQFRSYRLIPGGMLVSIAKGPSKSRIWATHILVVVGLELHRLAEQVLQDREDAIPFQ